MTRARFVFPLALGALGSCCALGDQVVLSPTKDNTIFSNDLLFGSVTSNGAGPHMFVGQTSFDGARRALIAFNIADSVPLGADIDDVTLSFNVSRGHGTQNITLHRLLADWGEGSSDSGEAGGRGAPAADGDATWMYHHYFSPENAQPWTSPGGDFVATESAHGTAAAVTFNLNSQQMAADVLQWRDNPSSNFGWILIGDESMFGAADRLDSRENSNVTFRPTLTIDYSVPGPPEWNLDADGSWIEPSNWSSNAVPSSAETSANFLGKITAPRTITLDAQITIGTINFDNANKYTIAPGNGGTLTIGGGSSSGAINLNAATHEISAKVITGLSSFINVPANGTLILSGGLQITSAGPLLMSGGGNVILSGP
ncbi:MAG TPA: DNRLRE domain-containing protein, partial [Tepidisphaeraceae bacterium]|nr:DNRLRE domain-containing protein [Tepidisphaeraceae bacterium]